jgi:hypothetical protein
LNFFKYIFSSPLPGRDSRNAPGDFYVQCDVCLQCGAPEAEAPDLIVMDFDGCYFKKQPETPEELEQAISAVAVSCISAVRYGGSDQKIIRRLYDLGFENDCDQPLRK